MSGVWGPFLLGLLERGWNDRRTDEATGWLDLPLPSPHRPDIDLLGSTAESATPPARPLLATYSSVL